MTGAEGAILDPLTYDFLFSTIGGGIQSNRISGFAPASIPEPSSLAFLGLAAAGFGTYLMTQRRRERPAAP